MIIVRVLVWIARIAGLGALVLGLSFWIAQVDLISLHMLFGLTLALSILVLSFVVIFTRGMRLLGAAGIVYTFILPLFGLTQATLLIGNLHWLIQAAHLLVGLGALALVQAIYTRYQRFKGPARGVMVSEQAAR
ncbi:MAG TPA: hypothetical protein VFQ30_11570 [Ktedonobacteraceae bacterium]|nr:hypothetical protein [Ktedonobacteraceae bacterium]